MTDEVVHARNDGSGFRSPKTLIVEGFQYCNRKRNQVLIRCYRLAGEANRGPTQPHTMSASTTTQPTTSSRSRTQSRKKVNDDAAYFGPPASSTSVSATKRQAPDKAEGEPRVKRKRVETHIVTPANGKRDNMESEPRKSLVSRPFSRSGVPSFDATLAPG